MSKAEKSFLLKLLAVFLLGLFASLVVPKAADIQVTRWYLVWCWPFFAWLFRELSPKIGDALLIALILALVVDEAAKHSLLTEFARDVSTHIIGRYLPRDLRDHIHGYLTVDVVRLDLDVVYRIEELEGGKGIVLTTVMMSDLHNYSNREIAENILITVSKSQDPAIGETLIEEVTVGEFTYRHGDSVKGLKSTGQEKVYTTTCRLAPASPAALPHGTRCVARFKEYFSSTAETAYVAVYPVLGPQSPLSDRVTTTCLST